MINTKLPYSTLSANSAKWRFPFWACENSQKQPPNLFQEEVTYGKRETPGLGSGRRSAQSRPHPCPPAAFPADSVRKGTRDRSPRGGPWQLLVGKGFPLRIRDFPSE